MDLETCRMLSLRHTLTLSLCTQQVSPQAEKVQSVARSHMKAGTYVLLLAPLQLAGC